MSVLYPYIYYKLVPFEYIILNASGDEKGKTFHFNYYPIRNFDETIAEIFLERKSQIIVLTKGTDYIVDNEESSVLFLKEINEGDNVYIENYEYEFLYYKYIYNIRMILGDTDPKSFIYSNKDIMRALRSVYFEIIQDIPAWGIEYDVNLDRIISDIDDYRFTYIAGFTALKMLEYKLRRKLNTAIVIRDGPTAIDTTRVVDTLKQEIDDYRKRLEQSLNDELIFGRNSNLIIGIVDDIAILAGEIINGDN